MKVLIYMTVICVGGYLAADLANRTKANYEASLQKRAAAIQAQLADLE